MGVQLRMGLLLNFFLEEGIETTEFCFYGSLDEVGG
jgi:hypothetical protein